jgi:hypothetical protein
MAQTMYAHMNKFLKRWKCPFGLDRCELGNGLKWIYGLGVAME